MGQRAAVYAVGMTLVATLLITAPAAAQLTPTGLPLPGSNFQGADGNQDNTATLDDWQFLEGADRVLHSPDPNAEDSAFTGGSKELEPGEWGLTTEAGGVNPAQENVRDAWSAVDQPGASTFLYLAFSREASEGTASISFELNHDDRLWDNGQAKIPCRRTGDVLISFEPQGNEVNLLVQRWRTTAWDAASSCATRGVLSAATSVEPNVDAQAALNSAAITNYLPGAYTNSMPTKRFGEVALNLAQLVEDAFGDECLSFSSVWMHSRSSNSVTSNMQDYVGPRPLNVWTCTASGTKFFDRDADGVRDPDDPGIPRFVIWADYDDDGVHDPGEPFGVSDRRGRYVIHDIQPPDGTYTLRERLLRRRSAALRVATDWQCSYPTTTAAGGASHVPGETST